MSECIYWSVMKKSNVSVKLNKKLANKDVEVANNILVKQFNRKFKKSGIIKELRDRRYPITKGEKKRLKRKLGRKRHLKKISKMHSTNRNN